MTNTQLIHGPIWRGRNWSADATGGIHDDATADKLGFRGGTVAGNIHMDQFVAPLRKAFGDPWLERGVLSMYFRNATVDGEPVRVSAESPNGQTYIRCWMHRETGDDSERLEIMSGTASLEPDAKTELRARDLRPCDPSVLRILGKLAPGVSIPATRHRLDSARQLDRSRKQWLSDPIAEFATADNRYGGIVASPSSLVDLLWGVPTALWRKDVGEAVGLFGAIEVAVHGQPLLLDRDYEVNASVVAVTDSPKTEGFWFDSTAHDLNGNLVASHRMLLRFMKASSALYQQ